MDNTYQCDESNSIKYIIDKGEYSLLKNKKFSEYDVHDFLTYCTPEMFSSLPKCCVRDIIYHANNIPHKIEKNMLDIFFDNGLDVPLEDIGRFANKNMVDHLEKTLSRKKLTQKNYIWIWQEASTGTEHIISKYFNDEAFDILRGENSFKRTFGMKGKDCLLFSALLSFLYGIMFAGLAAMTICGIIYDLELLFIMGPVMLFVLLLSAAIPLIFAIHAFIKYKRKYDRLLNAQYTNF